MPSVIRDGAERGSLIFFVLVGEIEVLAYFLPAFDASSRRAAAISWYLRGT